MNQVPPCRSGRHLVDPNSFTASVHIRAQKVENELEATGSKTRASELEWRNNLLLRTTQYDDNIEGSTDHFSRLNSFQGFTAKPRPGVLLRANGGKSPNFPNVWPGLASFRMASPRCIAYSTQPFRFCKKLIARCRVNAITRNIRRRMLDYESLR